MTDERTAAETALLQARAWAYAQTAGAGAARSSIGTFVLFRQGTSLHAVAASAITRVAPCPRITPVPGAPAWLAGLTHQEGRLLVVVNLGSSPWRDSVIAELAQTDGPLALRFDEVLEARELYEDELDQQVSTHCLQPTLSRAITLDGIRLLDLSRLEETCRLPALPHSLSNYP